MYLKDKRELARYNKRNNALNALLNIRLGREISRVTSHIDRAFGLVHAYIVDAHCRWESQALEVDLTKVSRHAQIHEDVLPAHSTIERCYKLNMGELTIGSTGTGRAPISTRLSAAAPGPLNVHAGLPSFSQVIYYKGQSQQTADKERALHYHRSLRFQSINTCKAMEV